MSKLQGTISKAVHSNASFEWYSPPDVSDGFEHVFQRRPDFDPASSAIANKMIRAKLFFSSKGLETPWPTSTKDEDVKALLNPPSPAKLWWIAFVQWSLRERFDLLGNGGLYVAYSIEQMQQTQHWTPEHPLMLFPHCVPNKRVRFWCRAFDALQKVNKRIDKLEDDLAGAAQALEEAKEAGLTEDVKTDGPLGEEVVTSLADTLQLEIAENEHKLRPLYKRRDELSALDPDELVPGEQPTHASAYVLLGANEEETQRFEDYFTEIGSVVIP